MLRILLGLALLAGVGAGGYYLGSHRSDTIPQEPQPLVDASLVIPEPTQQVARQPEAFDPVMFKMIENHFKDQAEWKSGQ